MGDTSCFWVFRSWVPRLEASRHSLGFLLGASHLALNDAWAQIVSQKVMTFVCFWISVLDQLDHLQSGATLDCHWIFLLSIPTLPPLPGSWDPCWTSCRFVHTGCFCILGAWGVFYKHTVYSAWELRGFPLGGKQLWGAWPTFILWRMRSYIWPSVWLY